MRHTRRVERALCVLALQAGAFGCADEPAGPASTDLVGTVLRPPDDPAEGVVVIVSGRPPVTTGSDGAFHISDPDSVYDLILVFPTWLFERSVRVYERLTSRHLRVVIPPLEFAPEVSATVSGRVPAAPAKVTRVYPSRFVSTTANPLSGRYALDVYWPSSLTVLTENLTVLRYLEGTNGLPSEFDGFAVRNLALRAGAAVSGLDFAEEDLSDPPDRSITGRTTVPSGYTLDGRFLDLVMQSSSLPLVSERFSIDEAFNYIVPELSSGTFQLLAFAAGPPVSRSPYRSMTIKTGILPGAEGVILDLRAAPGLISPRDGANDVDSTTLFEWEPGEEPGITVLTAYPETPPDSIETRPLPGPMFEIHLSGSSTRFPEIAVHSELLADAPYLWSVERRSYPASVDGLVSPTSVPVDEFWSAGSATNSFRMRSPLPHDAR